MKAIQSWWKLSSLGIKKQNLKEVCLGKQLVCEVEIYKCGGVRVDGVWYAPRKVKACVEFYKTLARPFVFKKEEDTHPRTALRVSGYFLNEF